MSGTTHVRVLDSDSNEKRLNKEELNKLSSMRGNANNYLHIDIDKEGYKEEIKRLKKLSFAIESRVYNDYNSYHYSYMLEFKPEKLIKLNIYNQDCSSLSINWITRDIAIGLITSENLDVEYKICLICSPDNGANKIANMTVEAINLTNLK